MGKTLEEMVEGIREYCNTHACKACPLHPLPEDWRMSYHNEVNGEELLKKHYELLFGKEESVACHTLPSGLDFSRKANDKVRLTFTRSQCESLAEFIERELLKAIRDDEDIDNVEWVADMMYAFCKFKKVWRV